MIWKTKLGLERKKNVLIYIYKERERERERGGERDSYSTGKPKLRVNVSYLF